MPKKIWSLTGKKVFVAGHSGMVGGAVVRRLQQEDCEVLTASRQELDLRDQVAVSRWMSDCKPEAVFLSAARVGGIHANSVYPVTFLQDNLQIQNNVISSAHAVGTEKLLFLGSSCIYPKMAPQPIPESSLLTGPLEPTNEWYAIAKIAGIKSCQAYRQQYGCDFISAMPTNLYGPGDNFHPENSHVPAALLQRFHMAKVNNEPQTMLWGSGKPLREFLFVDDLADALIFLIQNYSGVEHVNVGTGIDVSIAHFADLVKQVVGYEGEIVLDTSRPDGAPRKLLDVSKINSMGWAAQTELADGLKTYYQWYLNHFDRLRRC